MKEYSVRITFSEKEYEILKKRAKDKMRSIKSQAKYDMLSIMIEEEAYHNHMNGAS